VNEIMREYVESRQIESPFISSTCPAVIRLIQVRYPSLLKSVIPCEAPTEIAAWLAKTDASSKGRAQNPSVILISPCPAMITAVRQPVGRERSQVDAVVSARDAYVFVLENMKDSLADPSLDDASSTGLGMGCGRSGGELTAVGLRGLAVHGITQVASLLDELEKGNLRGEVNFVEAQACAGGCVGGCLNVETPFVSRVRIRDLVAKYKDSPPNPLIQTKNVKEPQLWFSLKLLPRPTFHLDDDPEIAEEKLRRLRSIEASLPGLDCGACGAPTCRALAEDIVLQRGALVDCTFKLRDRLEILAGEMKYLAGRRPPSMGDKEN
jgi:iron only hydrogenase large subunit-like protein